MAKQNNIKIKHSHNPDAFERICKKHNLRLTPQRMIIYKELVDAKDHPTVEKLYERVRKILPNISFDTVYRTAISFADIGLVKIVEGWGDPKRFDPNINPHHHFRCIKCHKIIDFDYEPFDQLKIPNMIKKQFEITHKRVVLEGLCETCKKQNTGKRH